MTRLATTGPSHVRPSDAAAMHAYLYSLAYAVGEVTTGGARGWDSMFARAAVECWPEALHRVVCPGAGYDRESLQALVKLAARLGVRLEVIELPCEAEAYRARNVLLVEHADVLAAAVRSREFYRSGEWMTVNIAKKAGVPIDFIDLGASA